MSVAREPQTPNPKPRALGLKVSMLQGLRGKECLEERGDLLARRKCRFYLCVSTMPDGVLSCPVVMNQISFVLDRFFDVFQAILRGRDRPRFVGAMRFL